MGLKKVGLLGTKFTMVEKFHEPHLRKNGIDVLLPDLDLHEKINEIIFSEICHNDLLETSKRFLLDVAQDLIKKGAEGIILACTELPTVIKCEDLNTILFSTTDLHAKAIAKSLMIKNIETEFVA
jgi:aspartate racemase